jgi:hypothetical protein
MRRDDICLHLSPANRSALNAIIKNRNSSSKAVWRAGIVLATADGYGTNEIMRRTGNPFRGRKGSKPVYSLSLSFEPVASDWLHDGPELPVEFARQSSDGRITLVVTPGVAPIRVYSAGRCRH